MNTLGNTMECLDYRNKLIEVLETNFDGLEVIDAGMGFNKDRNVDEIYIEYEYKELTHRITIMERGNDEPTYFDMLRTNNN
jgi:hypothetical protein